MDRQNMKNIYLNKEQNAKLLELAFEMLRVGIHLSYISCLINADEPDSEKCVDQLTKIIKERIRYHEQDIYFEEFEDYMSLHIGEESEGLILDMLEKIKLDLPYKDGYSDLFD
jgi:type II secretory ATPase GspE/PulE/Tfp pilus assembly ATPase PilB-like protein